jgi:type IV pilus assembly protein PilC
MIRLSASEIMLFSKHVSVLLGAGLPMDDALAILAQQAKGPLKTVINTLLEALKQGQSLTNGLERFPHIFSPVYINLVRAGENSGTLKDTLDNLSEHLKKSHELKQKIRGAMVYPAIVLVGTIMIGAGIVIFILPNITTLFKSLKVELPLTTRILLWIADTVENHGWAVLFTLIGIVVAIAVIRKIRFIKPFTHRILLVIPIVGGMVKNANLAQITRLMGTLLASGMPLGDALAITKPILKNVHYRKSFDISQIELARGNTFFSALSQYSYLYPPMAQRLINVGEESGTLGKMFEYLSDFYELELDNATKNLSTLLEPLLILVIGGMVAALALSIITPIYSIVGNV